LDAARGSSRSGLVRATLRRAYGLRAWLCGTPWTGTPVLAAVCSAPTLVGTVEPPVELDGLWLGGIELLPAWLASGGALDDAAAAEMAAFLAAELPIK
jgi:hypothetical protein